MMKLLPVKIRLLWTIKYLKVANFVINWLAFLMPRSDIVMDYLLEIVHCSRFKSPRIKLLWLLNAVSFLSKAASL